MDLSVSKKRSALALGGLLALTVCVGNVQATNLLSVTQNNVAVTSVNVSCNTATGEGATQTVVIKPVTALTGTNTITVGFIAPGGGIVVTAPASAVLRTSTTTLTYTINTSPGCVGNASNTKTIQFTAQANAGSVNNDVSLNVVDTLTTAASSGLIAPGVTVSCTKTGASTWAPGAAQTVSVTSTANGGIPFTVSTTGAAAWLNVSSTTGGTASSTPVTFTVAAASPCGSLANGSSATTTIALVSTGGGPNLTVTITLQVVPVSPLTVTPVPAAPSISLTYVKGSGTAATANVSVSSTVAGAFFTVNTATLPIWLTVNSTSGTATAPLAFSTTSVADTLAPGTYTATIYFKVSGYSDLGVPITLLVTNKAPKLSVNASTIPITWTLGSAPPTATITVSSSDSPIAYTLTTGGTLAPIVSSDQQSGLAYSFGSNIGVTFNPLIFATAQPGTVLTGTVTFTWGSPVSTTVVTISVTVASPGATLTGLSPATLPTATAGATFPISLSGSGFVGGSDTTLKTKVGVVVGGVLVQDTNFSVNVINASNMILTITVPATADPYLPFSPTGVGGPIYIGLCNGTCTMPTGTATITIGNGPIIQGATSASSFTEVTPPTLPTFAPYDMISLFGANFCASAGTGCGTTTLLSGTPDALTLRYPTTLSPDAVSATQRLVSVSFLQHGTNTVIAAAPLLFATNSQINLIVPAAVATYEASTVDIVVNFGYGSGATMLTSNVFTVNIASSDPGVFTVGSDGQGSAAALSTAWALITSANPAGIRTGTHSAGDSDTIQLYVTGLGAPDSTGDDTQTNSGCIAATSGAGNYESVLQAATSVSPALTSIDGAVIQSALLLSGNLPPCLSSAPTVTIGGVTANVTYAGFVADTVAGLYQINATLPSSVGTFYPNYPLTTSPLTNITAPVQLPVQITVGGVTSQSNVNVWVSPRLLMTGPAGNALNATVGVPWTGNVVAYEGTSPYRYAVTSGVLPAGLTLNASTGAITGTPGAGTGGTYALVITATDSANVPLTGTFSTTITVASALYISSTGTSPFNATYGTASPSLTTITATGGTYPYTYAITTPATPPAGMTVSSSGGVVGTSASTPAGVYNGVVVTATDSSSTPLTGAATFEINVALALSDTTPQAQTHGTSGVLTTVSAAGATGSVSYTLDSASVTNGFTIDSSGNLEPTNVSGSGSFTVTVTGTDSSMPAGATGSGVGSITISVTVS